jgi:FlaA1/EpsC-like NDP-sugar epimerase
MAELVAQELGRRHSTRYLALRFGSVVGSVGSVIPLFPEPIEAGGPVK